MKITRASFLSYEEENLSHDSRILLLSVVRMPKIVISQKFNF